MDKKNYYNTITSQIEELKELADIQTEKCFDVEKLGALLSDDAYAGLQRVVLTGCGDSYSACGAMLQAFKILSGIELAVVPDPMEFTRYYTEWDTKLGYSDEQVLVTAVSASGGSERIVEILEKGNKMGVNTMLISNNPESKGAKAAKTVYWVETPEGCNTPGLRSYFASMIAITALGAYIGLKKNLLSLERFTKLKQEIANYVKDFMKEFERIDDQAFELALQMKEYDKFETVGDGPDYFSALFVEQKVIECPGVFCMHSNSEEWCHISMMVRDNEHIGTVFHATKASPSYGRMVDTTWGAAQLGRPSLVVTDGDPKDFNEKLNLCIVPSAPEYWLAPLMNFCPGSLLVAYQAAVNDKNFFGGRYNFRTKEFKFD